MTPPSRLRRARRIEAEWARSSNTGGHARAEGRETFYTELGLTKAKPPEPAGDGRIVVIRPIAERHRDDRANGALRCRGAARPGTGRRRRPAASGPSRSPRAGPPRARPPAVPGSPRPRSPGSSDPMRPRWSRPRTPDRPADRAEPRARRRPGPAFCLPGRAASTRPRMPRVPYRPRQPWCGHRQIHDPGKVPSSSPRVAFLNPDRAIVAQPRRLLQPARFPFRALPEHCLPGSIGLTWDGP